MSEAKESYRGHPLHNPDASPEMLLRGEWWLGHGDHCRPYGDDGEMQCCGLDFRRMPFAELRERVSELRMRRVAAALAGTAAREQLPPAVNCAFCGYGEYVVDGEWDRALRRRADHEAQCNKRPAGLEA